MPSLKWPLYVLCTITNDKKKENDCIGMTLTLSISYKTVKKLTGKKEYWLQ